MGAGALSSGRRLIDLPVADFAAARESVVASAQDLIRQTADSLPGWNPPPFDPAVYALVLGIPVTYVTKAAKWDAVLFTAPDGRSRIMCNGRGATRRRMAFSVAHELAHTFFSDQARRYRATTRGNRAAGEHPAERPEELVLERLCDIGAAELLMPRPWFAAALARHGLRASSVPRLAEEFNVSLEAAAIRVASTSPEPCAVGFFDLAPRPSLRALDADRRWQEQIESTAYRVRRLFASPGFPFLLPEGKSVPESSAIHRCSMQRCEIESVEDLGIPQRRRLVRVTAIALHRNPAMDEPPAVCGLLRSV